MLGDLEKKILEDDSSTVPDPARDDLTAKKKKAKEASDALNANESDSLDLGIRFGEALTMVKLQLKHGEYGKYCKDDLNRSASSCSLYTRIFESREDVRPALNWAAEKGHPLARCRSIRPVLKVIGDWKKVLQHGDSEPAPSPQQKPSKIIAELRQRLAHAEEEFVGMRDTVPPDVNARVMQLVVALAGFDMTAIEELAGIARDYHWRLRDLVAMQNCTAVQVSLLAPEVSADPNPETPKDAKSRSEDEAGGACDHGSFRDSSSADAAPATALENPGTDRVLDEASSEKGAALHEISRNNPLRDRLQRPGKPHGMVVSDTLRRNSGRVAAAQLGGRQ